MFNLLKIFKKNKDENKEKDNSMFKILERYDLKSYNELKYNLIYAHDELLVDNENIIIAVRKYKKTLLKICLVHNFKELNNYKLDNESLKKYAESKGYLEEISLEDLDCNKEVRLIIIKELSEDVKKYCFINASASKDSYNQYMIYDEEHSQLLRFRELKDFDTPIEGFNTAMYFDLACIDKENY